MASCGKALVESSFSFFLPSLLPLNLELVVDDTTGVEQLQEVRMAEEVGIVDRTGVANSSSTLALW